MYALTKTQSSGPSEKLTLLEMYSTGTSREGALKFDIREINISCITRQAAFWKVHREPYSGGQKGKINLKSCSLGSRSGVT